MIETTMPRRNTEIIRFPAPEAGPGTQQAQPYCLITGAGRGLGLALAEECAGLGMNLILVDLPNTGLPDVTAHLARSYGVAAVCSETDLTDPDSPETLHRWIKEQRIDLFMLINNAGIGAHGPFTESAAERNRAMINLNITALVHLTQLFLPELARQQNAYILNVASLAAFYPMPCKPVYAPTKAFVLNFSLALRTEMTGTSIKVSALCPGGIITNEECRRLIAAQGFIGRISCHHPEEVARYAVDRLLRGRALIIPGFLNKAARICGAVAPRSLVQRFVHSRFTGAPEKGKRGSTTPPLEVLHG